MELAASDTSRHTAAVEGTKPVTAKKSGRRMVMRLHIVQGTFSTPPGRQCAMDAELWSRLPEDIIWRVLRFVPAAKQFQFQLVSPNWRQMLTSTHFRNTIGVAAPEESERQGVVACVTPGGNSSTSISSRRMKMVDIDLSSFVPDSFWKSDTYDVVAAADGLVVISNDRGSRLTDPTPKRNRHCLVNPLTRSCKVLPDLPFSNAEWLPPTTTTLTIHGYQHLLRSASGALWEIAIYDLTTTGTGGGWVSRTYNTPQPMRLRPEHPELAVCAGETFFYHDENAKVHVLAADPAGRGTLVDAAAAIDLPSVASLGRPLDSSSHRFDRQAVSLVAHRGAVFLIALLVPHHDVKVYYDGDDGDDSDVVDKICGLWRLARDRMEWEAVARLDEREVVRLIGEPSLGLWFPGRGPSNMFPACEARELLCCVHVLEPSYGHALIGFNLVTRQWELVHQEEDMDWPIELRPDVFLS